jgi:hypothetical protein
MSSSQSDSSVDFSHDRPDGLGDSPRKRVKRTLINEYIEKTALRSQALWRIKKTMLNNNDKLNKAGYVSHIVILSSCNQLFSISNGKTTYDHFKLRLKDDAGLLSCLVQDNATYLDAVRSGERIAFIDPQKPKRIRNTLPKYDHMMYRIRKCLVRIAVTTGSTGTLIIITPTHEICIFSTGAACTAYMNSPANNQKYIDLLEKDHIERINKIERDKAEYEREKNK